MNSDFYIGYLPKMPNRLKRIIRAFVLVILLAAVSLAVIFATGQQRFASSVFLYGNPSYYYGTIQARPVPFLLIEQQAKNNGLPTFNRHPLVGTGKHGVGEEVTKLDGKRVKLLGTLIERDGLVMIEVVSGSIEEQNLERGPGRDGDIDLSHEVISLGQMTLRGEIIDSKCYLGVMNPGNKKTHRDCAVACLRGGVPAMFLVKDEKGNKSELWLLSDVGDAINDQILDYVAEPVELTGRVTRQGDQLFYWVKASTIRRL